LNVKTSKFAKKYSIHLKHFRSQQGMSSCFPIRYFIAFIFTDFEPT